MLTPTHHFTWDDLSPRGRHVARVAALALPLFIYTAIGFFKSLPAVSLVTQVGVLILLAGWRSYRAIRRRGLAVTPLNLPLVAYLAALVVAVLASTDPRTSLDALVTVAALVLFYFLFCDLLLAGWRPEVFVDALLVIVGLFLVEALGYLAFQYARWLFLSVSVYPKFLIQPQIYGVADHPNLLAGLINLALPFAILRLAGEARLPLSGSTIQERDGRPMAARGEARFLWRAYLLAATVVLYYTQSRTGWVATAAVVGLILFWLFVPPGRPHRHAWRVWLTTPRRTWLTLGAYLAVFLLLAALNTRASTSEYTGNAGGFTAGRGILWQVAWDSFTSRPLTGTGPLTFTRQYMDMVPFQRANSYTPNHAHNLLLDTLAQAGLGGGLALVWLIGTGVLVCLTAWGLPSSTLSGGWLARSVPRSTLSGGRPAVWAARSRRGSPDAGGSPAKASTPVRAGPERVSPLLVATCAALAGFLVHSLFDLISWLPSIALVVVMLASLAMHAAGQVQPGACPRRLAHAALALAILAVLALPPLFVRDYTARHALGLAIRAAGNGQWMATTIWLEAAVQADPGNIHYLRQRAYVYGVRAAPRAGPGDPLALNAALSAYKALFTVQDSWVPDLLNAGMLNQLAGNEGEAQRLYEAAVPRWEGWPLPALLLGDSYARQGRREEARLTFADALVRNARAGDTVACLQNPLCRSQAAELLQPSGSIGTVHQEARGLLDAGQSVQALALLQGVPISARSALIWIDRAEAHIALGQLREGRYALEVAAALDGDESPDSAARLALLRAALFTQQERHSEAIAALETVMRPRIVFLPYDMIYRQFSMPGLFVPRLAMLERTIDDLEAYHRLAQLYTLAGRTDDAEWADRQATALEELMAQAVENGAAAP